MEIKNLEDEIISLEEKINSIDKQLSSIRRDISESGWQDDQARNRLRTLKDDRHILESVLKEKRETLSDLQKQAERNAKIEELKELAEQAMEMQDQYKELLIEIDKFLASKIPKLVKVQSDWKQIGWKFNNLADNLEKGFKWATSRHLSVDGRQDELTSQKLIDDLEADGVDLNAVLSETAISHRNYNHLRKGVDTSEMYFIMAIYEMMKQRNIAELMERKPETETA